MKNNDKTKVIVGIVIGVIVFIAIFFAVHNLMKPSLESYLTTVSHEINKQCPIPVDRETRLDNSMVLPNKVFQYNYTLINLNKEQVDIDQAQKVIEPNLISNIKTNPDMSYFRDNKVQIIYSYRDKTGVFLFKIRITPEMYTN
ncbi:MAG: hypothetical protein E2604_08695 [Flavobacterium sp.]|jgi:hypothetical protein|nr:hypothetical protein [Flavobacterium sp.]